MSGVNIWGVLGAVALTLSTAGFIAYQGMQITGLQNERVLLLEKVENLEGAVTLGLTERVRLTKEIKDYQNRKAEIEIRYITKPVTVFKEIIKEVPAEVVTTKANEETNALFDAINSSALSFSLPNNQD